MAGERRGLRRARDAARAGSLQRRAGGARACRRLRLGIGIHCGAAIAGVIGSHELLEFTVIGRTVNLAARVERLTRVHQADILVTAAVRAALDPRYVLEELPAREVRGVAEPVVTYAVRGMREP